MNSRVFTSHLPCIFLILFTGPHRCADAQKESVGLQGFDRNSGISRIEVNPETGKALVLLGKVWGLVKYHHPKLKSRDVNWDHELFRVLPGYLVAGSAKERSDILVGWINGLGPMESLSPAAASGREIRLYPDLRWVDELESKELTAILNEVVRSNGAPTSYVSFHFLSGTTVFEERPSSAPTYPDAGYRLLALYRYWNIVQYYSPYRELPDIAWSTTLEDFIPRFLQTKNALEYQQNILGLAQRLQDGHANYLTGSSELSSHLGDNIAVMQVGFIEDQLVVVKLWEENTNDDAGIRVGDVITSIDGEDVVKIAARLADFVPASNKPTQQRYIANIILRTNASEISVEFCRESGKPTRSTKIRCLPRSDVKKLTAQKREEPAWEIRDGIGYCIPSRVGTEGIAPMIDGLKQVESVVVDLREYPGVSAEKLARPFISEPTRFAWLTLPQKNQPGAFYYFGRKVGVKTPFSFLAKRNTFEGRVAILVNEATQSAGEYAAMALRVAPNARVFGSTTAGADGNISMFDLPGGIKTRISGVGVYTPEKKDTQRVGIIPDVLVRPTLSGVRQGKDQVLETALDWLSTGN